MLGELAFRLSVWLELYHPFSPERCLGCEYVACHTPEDQWPPWVGHPRTVRALVDVEPFDPIAALERWPEATIQAMRDRGIDPLT